MRSIAFRPFGYKDVAIQLNDRGFDSIKRTINSVIRNDNKDTLEKVCTSLNDLCNAWKNHLLTRAEFEDLYKLLLENTRLSSITPEDIRRHCYFLLSDLETSSRRECYREVLGMPHSRYLRNKIEFSSNLSDFLKESTRVNEYIKLFPNSNTFAVWNILSDIRI